MTSDNTKKTGFIDRFASDSSQNTDDSMFLNTDLIHEGISDDDLDLLLAGDIKSSVNPPKNPAPAEFTESELIKDDLTSDLELLDNSHEEIDELAIDSDIDDELLSIDEIDSELQSEIDDLTDITLTVVAPDKQLNDIPSTDDDSLESLVPDLTLESQPVSKEILENESINSSNSNEISVTNDLKDNISNPFVTPNIINSDSIKLVDPQATEFKNNNYNPSPAELVTNELTNEFPNIKKSIRNENLDLQHNKIIKEESSQILLTNSDQDNLTLDVVLDNDKHNGSELINHTELKTIIHPVPDSVKSRLNNPEVLDVNNSDREKNQINKSSNIVNEKKHLNTQPLKVNVNTVKKPVITKKQGNNSMTNSDETALIEKVQVDIDELKRKLHSMNSDFYNAATDSAALISQVRELTTKSSGDFTGTYGQSRELRRVLVEARKVFNQLASGIDMLEESLETDLFEIESK